MSYTDRLVKCKDTVSNLKDLGINVSCYSARSENTTGLATVDCDYAIDVLYDKNSINKILSLPCNKITDPYNNGRTNMIRLKYKL